MINLFHIPNYILDTSKFKSLLHDSIVNEFEHNFARYVGAKYAVSLNSATNAIYLINKLWKSNEDYIIPTMIPIFYELITSRPYEQAKVSGCDDLCSPHKVDFVAVLPFLTIHNELVSDP